MHQPDLADPPVTERDRVLRWRRRCLQDAGYPADCVPALARRLDIDLHAACDLLTVHGCDPLVAARILL